MDVVVNTIKCHSKVYRFDSHPVLNVFIFYVYFIFIARLYKKLGAEDCILFISKLSILYA